MAEFANPYLIAILKKLWLLESYGEDRVVFSIDDKFQLANLSNIGVEFIRKVLRADTTVSFYEVNTLNGFCKAISSKVPTVPVLWKDLAKIQINNKVYDQCQLLKVKKKGTKISELSGDFTGLQARINRAARSDAEQILSLKANLNSGINIPEIQGNFFSRIRRATFQDVSKIYEFARSNKSYGDCPINGPEIKEPWFLQNPNIFYIIHDQDGNVCANLNLLPLREECYKRLFEGKILEKDIKPKDIYPLEDKHLVRYIYVEGFNCRYEYQVTYFLSRITEILANLVLPNRRDLIIGAIGGTEKGDKLMKRLKFNIAKTGGKRKDKYDFFELDFNEVYEEYDSFQQIIQ